MEGVEVEIGGAWLSDREPPESEAIGLAFAVFVLIMAVGSVVAMGLTVGTALVGVGVGAAAIALLSNAATVPEFAPTIGVMIGIGVGIDYALFIITRYREWIGHGPGRCRRPPPRRSTRPGGRWYLRREPRWWCRCWACC